LARALAFSARRRIGSWAERYDGLGCPERFSRGRARRSISPIFPLFLRTILAAQEHGKDRPAVLCQRVREQPVILDPVGGVLEKSISNRNSAGSCGRAELDDGSIHLPRPGPR